MVPRRPVRVKSGVGPHMGGQDNWQFQGFRAPHYTMVPDEVFDELLSVLTGAELKVLLYVTRRTFGFKKTADSISINQMVKGITKVDGTELDKGTGLSRRTLLPTLRKLEEKGIIVRKQEIAPNGGSLPSTYALRFADDAQQRVPGGGGEKSSSPGGEETAPPEEKGSPRPEAKSNRPPGGEEISPHNIQRNNKQFSTATTTGDRDEDVVVAVLEKFAGKINRRTAARLVGAVGSDVVQEQLEWIEYRAVEKPANAFVVACEEKWGPPESRELAQERTEPIDQAYETYLASLERTDEAGRRWEALCTEFREQIDPHSFNTWFQPTSGAGFENGTLIVSVPNEIFGSWITDNYAQELTELAGGEVRFVSPAM